MKDQSIVITPVANGFMVELPEVSQSIIPDMEPIIDMLNKLKDGMFSEGEKWKEKQKAEAEEILKKLKPIDVDQQTHIFKTFPEVLSFLTEQFPQI